MITPNQAAQLCRSIYNPIADGVFSTVLQASGITAGMHNNVVAFAGSETIEDWVRDFYVLQYTHPLLGTLHEGMWDGMAHFFAAFPHDISKPLVLTGHSLGCAHAAIFAGLCAIAGLPVEQLILFAPPRCSFQKLRDVLATHVGQIIAYRNGHDPVPDVPLTIPIIEPWVPIADYSMMNQPPDDPRDVFAWHAIDLYCQAAQTL